MFFFHLLLDSQFPSLFHLSSSPLFIFPSQYFFTIGNPPYFVFEVGAPILLRSPSYSLTLSPSSRLSLSSVFFSFGFSPVSSRFLSLFRSPLLLTSLLIPSPSTTLMFQFIEFFSLRFLLDILL